MPMFDGIFIQSSKHSTQSSYVVMFYLVINYLPGFTELNCIEYSSMLL